MVTFEVHFDSEQLQEIMNHFNKTISNEPENIFPNTAVKFGVAADMIQSKWKDIMSKIPGVSSNMIGSVKKFPNGIFDWSIYSNSRPVKELNDGSPAVEYDMKKTHPYGKHSRVSKKGIPYLIVKFQWRTPGQSDTHIAHKEYFSGIIPRKVYNTAIKGWEMSRVISQHDHFEKNARGEDVERWAYEWIKNSRLSDDLAWNERSKGMVRFNTSKYFTFRVISAKSPANSWIYRKKAKPATNFMNEVETEAKQIALEQIGEGFRADIENLNVKLNNGGLD